MTKNIIELREHIQAVLHQLTPRDQKILDMRFGLTDDVPHTLAEVGRVFSVRPERIRQIEAHALALAIKAETKTSR